MGQGRSKQLVLALTILYIINNYIRFNLHVLVLLRIMELGLHCYFIARDNL